MPHLLDGCHAKIHRAEENLHILNKELDDYLRKEMDSFRIVVEHQNEGKEYAFVAYGESDVPLKFSIMAGEIIHHCRSSLDYLIHALVIQNGEVPTRSNQFPICTTEDSFNRACKSGMIKGVSESARNFIAAVQPYTTDTPDDTILNVLHQYDIEDKHKLLVLVSAIVKIDDKIVISVDEKIATSEKRKGKIPNIIGFSDSDPKKITNEGTVLFKILLGEPAPELVAKANLSPNLAFDKCGKVEMASFIMILKGLLEGTRHTIDIFSDEF